MTIEGAEKLVSYSKRALDSESVPGVHYHRRLKDGSGFFAVVYIDGHAEPDVGRTLMSAAQEEARELRAAGHVIVGE